MRKINFTVLFAIVLFCFAGCSTPNNNLDNLAETDDPVQKELIKSATQLNSMCPMTVDKETRLDNAAVLPNRTLQYNYTFVNRSKEDINVEGLKAYSAPIILNNLKTNPDLKAARENKITFIYYCKDKDGVFLFSLKYEYNDYSGII